MELTRAAPGHALLLLVLKGRGIVAFVSYKNAEFSGIG